MKVRADVLLVAQGLAETRSRAQALILAGAVTMGEHRQRIDKPGTLIDENVELHGQTDALPYVSRGGLKLARAIEHFALAIDGKVCLDVGASTGGFTDCLLQHGAKRIFALDVGYGQLAWQLRQDERVVVLERTNVRTVPSGAINLPIDLAVVDVSFISLRLVLPHLGVWLKDGAHLAALIKPQFELGRADIGKGGIVTSQAAQQRACENALREAERVGFEMLGTTESPILGAKGNREFLMVGRFAKARFVPPEAPALSSAQTDDASDEPPQNPTRQEEF